MTPTKYKLKQRLSLSCCDTWSGYMVEVIHRFIRRYYRDQVFFNGGLSKSPLRLIVESLIKRMEQQVTTDSLAAIRRHFRFLAEIVKSI